MADSGLTLVIGATGMLGRPVVRRLVADGRHVRALVRDLDRARDVLPGGCELIRGDVRDRASLESAMQDTGAVYINLAAPRSPRRPDTERECVPIIIDAARASGVGHLLKISFMGVPGAADLWWQVRHKAESQRALADSGLDFTIFQPTWFMESLALFRAGRRLLLPKVADQGVYWLAGDDYARQVSAALVTPTARNRTYVAQGFEPLSFRAAARRLAAAWPDRPLKFAQIPAWAIGAMAPVVADARYLRDLLRVTFETNTTFEAQPCWDDLGEPRMTIEQYAASLRETGDIPRK